VAKPQISPLKEMCIGTLILAGGQGVRMGGADKGLLQLAGHALVDYAIARVQGQQPKPLHHIAINANRHHDAYARRGWPVWPDDQFIAGQGPLAGFLTGLRGFQRTAPTVTHLWVVPCDTPMFPDDLLQRLATAMAQTQATVALPYTADSSTALTNLQAHPTFCLMRMDVLPQLEHYVQQGGRKVLTWTQEMHATAVVFDRSAYQAHNFCNANTPDELAALAQAFQRAN
jgi:molybdenum cofactor guanylyltransferase